MASQLPPGTDLSMVPAAMPPPGVTPQFQHPSSLTPTLIGLCVFLITWGTSFAVIRVWINRSQLRIGDSETHASDSDVDNEKLKRASLRNHRRRPGHCLLLDSALVYINNPLPHSVGLLLNIRCSRAVLSSWVGCAAELVYSNIYQSDAQYSSPLVAKLMLTSGKLLYAQGMLLGPTIFFSKEAIFLLYFEVFHVKNQMRLAIIFGMVFTGFVYWTGIIIESIFCAPRIGESWDPLAGSPVSMRCQKTIYWGIVQGACAIVIDVLIFVLPIPIVMKLQLPTRRKVQILCVFMTALMYVVGWIGSKDSTNELSRGILASVFAQVYRVRLLTHSADQSWEQARQLICVQVINVRTDRSQIADKPMLFSIVENWVAVIVSCTPAFAKFCRLYIGESHFFASLQSRLSIWISGARSTLNKPLHQSDASHMESQGGLRPRSLSTAGPYYHLEERTPSRDAKSWTTQDARSAGPLAT
ncbi:MAG: hypothetical protein Q9210_003492 [Variospora velana]